MRMHGLFSQANSAGTTPACPRPFTGKFLGHADDAEAIWGMKKRDRQELHPLIAEDGNEYITRVCLDSNPGFTALLYHERCL